MNSEITEYYSLKRLQIQAAGKDRELKYGLRAEAYHYLLSKIARNEIDADDIAYTCHCFLFLDSI